MNANCRIGLEDNMITAMMKLAEGNPGAATAMLAITKNAAAIDPDDAFGALGALLSLDSFSIYGSSIYVLYSDICERDVTKFLACLRATQLGFIPQSQLQDAASRQDRSGRTVINPEELLQKVQERLPAFGRVEAA